MDDKGIIGQLEELAQRVGITVRYEPLKMEGFIHTGGFCRVKGKDFVIINKKATARERMPILIGALRRYDLSQIYIVPSLREILDGEKGR
jgi:hypothetical protein